MSASASRNQRFLVLDEFVCQAIASDRIRNSASHERGSRRGESETLRVLEDAGFKAAEPHAEIRIDGQRHSPPPDDRGSTRGP